MELSGLLLVAGCTIALLVFWWRSLRARGGLRPLLAGGPLRPLHAVRSGRVYVRGKVTALKRLTAPLSGAEVVGYRVLVERRESQGEWARLLDHWEVSDFELHEESCGAAVSGEGAVLLITRQAESLPLLERDQQGMGRRLPEVIVGLLQLRCQYTPSEHEVGRLRWSEFQLLDGDQVFVVGEVSMVLARDGRLTHGGAAYRATPTRRQIEGSAKGPVVICDCSREELLELITATVGAERFVPRGLLGGR